ncbi:hypothetical protein GCM10022248_46930 [Nonomuraea soli]
MFWAVRAAAPRILTSSAPAGIGVLTGGLATFGGVAAGALAAAFAGAGAAAGAVVTGPFAASLTGVRPGP